MSHHLPKFDASPLSRDEWIVVYQAEPICRERHRIPMRSADHKKGGSLTSLLYSVYSRVRNEISLVYQYELFCRDKHLSGFLWFRTLDSREFLPSLTEQSLPHSLCLKDSANESNSIRQAIQNYRQARKPYGSVLSIKSIPNCYQFI